MRKAGDLVHEPLLEQLYTLGNTYRWVECRKSKQRG